MGSILVLGLGNVLQGDDGVGVHIVRWLAGQAPMTGVTVLDGGTIGASLLVELEGVDALLVADAVESGQEAGQVTVFQGAEMDHLLARPRAGSVHEAGLAELLDMARLLDCLPPRRALLGIQPRTIAWGDALSPPLARSLPEAGCRARALLEEWRREDS
ncbi:hydrogenase maturation protease [Acidithiobacillus sp.]|jgi:hydrogenase maturation protease|uniref:hydrogenase maturation protease n=1 Tax=Acidithiobacillus sp. TaxID=1872118 RepID=UPI0026126E8F|nr:hydrogenase maturation protease [Acidithiobacillus sp.]